MNSTLSDTSARERIANTLPAQAQQLLEIERRERERVTLEKEAVRSREAALESELNSALEEEKRAAANEGMRMLQEFSQRDLVTLIKKESLETEEQAEAIKNAGLAGVHKAAQALADAALSENFLSAL